MLREDAVPRFEEQASERRRDSCPFVQKGSVSIRWDGSVSPCLPLLHTHESYLGDRMRRIEAFSVGALAERRLKAIWEDPAYVALRTRLLEFDFSPCSWCNSCDFPDSNREDCFGSPAPACGGLPVGSRVHPLSVAVCGAAKGCASGTFWCALL